VTHALSPLMHALERAEKGQVDQDQEGEEEPQD
jgi:hypothetical protein